MSLRLNEKKYEYLPKLHSVMIKNFLVQTILHTLKAVCGQGNSPFFNNLTKAFLKKERDIIEFK